MQVHTKRYPSRNGRAVVGFVPRYEVGEVMRRANLSTVTEAMRLLFPRIVSYSCAGRSYRFIEAGGGV